MAHKESEKITADKYTLGGYTFDFTERDTSVFVTCTGPDGKTATKGASIGQSEVDGWYVEANGDTASVYIIQKIPIGEGRTSPLDTGIPQPLSSGGGTEYTKDHRHVSYSLNGVCYPDPSGNGIITIIASSSRTDSALAGTMTIENLDTGETSTVDLTTNMESAFQYDGKIAWYGAYRVVNTNIPSGGPRGNQGAIAWTMLYGTPSWEDYELKEVLIARFAIDAIEAGSGPEDSYDDPEDWEDWDDPEDYDPGEDPIEYGDPDYPDPDDPDYPEPIEYGDPDYPDPDDPDYPDPIEWGDPDYPDPEDPDYPGDQDGDGEPDPYHPDYHPDYYPPTKTLYLTVTGATSGTHESGITAEENKTIADYGCGGNGGHGGGGGAGSSTVVIHKFATSKANSKEVTAISQPHGYGSGGGKGGKGGDGIILIYY